jgi:peptidoglycan/xylan/chitin deacetylase (PgdA/CDA1 family)
MKATFFLIGKHAEEHPELVKQIVAGGNSVENHTYDHGRLSTLDPAGVQRELLDAEKAISRITGHKPEFYRPPYGATTPGVADLASRQGLREVGWTLDTRDWERQNRSVPLLTRTLSTVKSGDIVLMHDAGLPTTVELVPAIASILRARHLCPGRLIPTTRTWQAWQGWDFYVRPAAW